jgi:hypothetical protein
MSAGNGGPRARQDGLIIERIGDELLVYDTGTSRAHSLNATSAAVFESCDGSRSVEQITEETGLDADAVGLALADLDKSGLLEGYAEPSERVSRRTVIRRLAVAGAGIGVAVPVIRSITAPTPALAISASHKGSAGQPCTPPGGRSGFQQAGCSSSSLCNSSTGPQQSTCFRSSGASCLHGSSCYATAYGASACGPGGTCVGSCSQDNQCRTGYTCQNPYGTSSFCAPA